MTFTLYTANCTGNAQNSIYPTRTEVNTPEDMLAAVAYDHVCAEYKGAHRSADDYLSGDVDVMDCDNDHSDDPEDWITPEMYENIFPDVSYVVVPSRNNMKPKGGKSARPRHHVYFLHSDTFTAEDCAGLKRRIYEAAPFFDGNALDAARFIFGCTAEDIIWHEGSRTIEDFLDEQDLEDFDRELECISEGSRNSTISRIAGRIIKKYGNTDEAYQRYLKKSELCDPPLGQEELDTIWSSAGKFWKKISAQPGYIPPEEYGNGWSLKPDDYSDIGQAKVLSREYGGELVYTDATDYMRYDGTRWAESKQMAVGACEEFLDSQLTEAQAAVESAKEKLLAAGVSKEANMSKETVSVYEDPFDTPRVKIGTLSPREAFGACYGEGFSTINFRNSSGVVTQGYIPEFPYAPEGLYTRSTEYPYGTVEIDGETFYTFKFRRSEEVYTAAGNRWGAVASGMRVACRTDMMGENHRDWKAINYVERSTDGAWIKVTGDGYNYGFVDTGLNKGSMPNSISMYGTW